MTDRPTDHAVAAREHRAAAEAHERAAQAHDDAATVAATTGDDGAAGLRADAASSAAHLQGAGAGT